MKIKLNNTDYSLSEGTSLQQFLLERSLHEMKGSAIALNGVVIPRSKWNTTQLSTNDSIIMITASQGG